MNRKLYLAYILFSIAAFCAITGWSCFRFFTARNASIEQGGDFAASFKDAAVKAFQLHGTLDNAESQAEMKRKILTQSNLRLAAVYSADGLQYLYAADRSYVGFNLSFDDFSPDPSVPESHMYRYNRILERIFSRTFSRPATEGNKGGTYTVDIIVSLITKAALYLIIRDALIGFAALFIVTCVFIIISSSVNDRLPLPSGSEGNEAVIGGANAEHSAEKYPKEISPNEQQEKSAQASVLHAADMSGDKPSAESGNSRCMYSPASGLGWMQYLSEKLTFELRRAASFDQDLVLILMTTNQTKRGEVRFKSLAARILETFRFQDLAFEYTERGFAVIIPNADLDHVMGSMRLFTQDLKKITSPPLPLISAGLTSRNGRLLSGDRMIAEGKKALAKAETDGEGSIIGFRPDPIKYRQYIASKA